MKKYEAPIVEVEIFTVGDVRIDLNENFEQGATLIPGKNIDKVPTITNTGNNAAWVWMTVAIPAALDNYNNQSDSGSVNNVIHWNPLGATTAGEAAFAAEGKDYSYVTETRVNNAKAAKLLDENLTAEVITEKNMTWNVYNNFVNGGNAYKSVKIGEVEYNVYVLPYNKALQPGETTLPSLYQVALDARVDIDPEGNWHFVQDGQVTDLNWNSAEVGNPIIYVSAYAIQMASFDNVKAGFDAYIGQWGELNGYYDTIIPTIENGILNVEDDLTLLDNTLIREYEATKPYTVNGNGKTVTMVASSVDSFAWDGDTIPLQSLIFSSANGSDVVVNDLTIAGIMQSVMAGNYRNATYNNYNTTFNNVNIVNTQVVSFSAGVSPALTVYGTMTMNGCKVYGTTLSPLDTDPMWPVYDMALVNYSDTTINDSKIGSIYVWNQAKLTVADGTEVDTIVIRGNMNTTKYGVTIKAGATVDTIDLSAITNKSRVNFTIEDGATVGKFVANGVEYATLADWQNA